MDDDSDALSPAACAVAYLLTEVRQDMAKFEAQYGPQFLAPSLVYRLMAGRETALMDALIAVQRAEEAGRG